MSKVIAVCLLAFVLPVLMFPTLHRAHAYYGCESAIFLLFAIAAALSTMPEKLKIICAGAIVAGQLATFSGGYGQTLKDRHDWVMSMAALIDAHTRPDDVLVILGEEWNPELPYYAHRKALMMTTLADQKVWVEEYKKVPNHKVIIDCREGNRCAVSGLR